MHNIHDLTRLRRMRDQRATAEVLNKMRHGATLHLQHVNGRALWSLSNGEFVSAAIAGVIIALASVEPAGDALFAETPGQTWRMR
jgi:hypothetical protein